MNALIHVRNMTIGHKDRPLYSGVSFDIREGECIMLCGANGSGKTTLLNALEQMAGDIVMIPTRIPKVPGFTLKEFVRISCYRQSDMGGRLSKDDEAALDAALKALGLSTLASQDISTLSDGEFQKAGIAAALVRKASVILLDEPTAFLDAENRINVLKTLRNLCNGGQSAHAHRPAIIFSTHDLHDGLSVATRVFALGADGIFRQTMHTTEEEAGNKEAQEAGQQAREDAVRSIFLKPF